MPAYYNEIDPYCVEWLKNLIREKLIADGVVDNRSILDVRPYELASFNQCHFFAGLGGWSLALRTAGWEDHRQVWTGSCPCQPFSAAGKQRGFADERHLWPWWRYLIAQRRPSVVFGEQVANSAEWQRLVRGDLEALDYAVGCMPIEAASAGADHLRDRFWFVGDYQGERRREGRTEHEVRSGRHVVSSASGVGMADANEPGSQGRLVLPERAGQRIAGANGVGNMAYTQRDGARRRSAEDTGTQCAPAGARGEYRNGNHAERPRKDVNMGDTSGAGTGRHGGAISGAESGGERIAARRVADQPQPSSIEWVIGADGKARRVKSGIRLLVDGVPARVAKLRAFGNAIDPRPAAAFIESAMDYFDSQTGEPQ